LFRDKVVPVTVRFRAPLHYRLRVVVVC
jgi:hypothetical protein